MKGSIYTIKQHSFEFWSCVAVDDNNDVEVVNPVVSTDELVEVVKVLVEHSPVEEGLNLSLNKTTSKIYNMIRTSIICYGYNLNSNVASRNGKIIAK